MLDPLISLAFGIHSRPGVFSLLLGSGVSRAAQILTGWEIVGDLARKLAKLAGEDPEPVDPIAWYKRTHGSEPNSSDLLLKVAPSRAERPALLQGYFEPTAGDIENGRKVPTAAINTVLIRRIQHSSIRLLTLSVVGQLKRRRCHATMALRTTMGPRPLDGTERMTSGLTSPRANLVCASILT